MKEYICIEDFDIDIYDDDGFWTEKSKPIQKGTLFELDDSKFRLIGAQDSIRLTNKTDWIEISKEHFDRLFKEVNTNVEKE